jgi:hypothetical protein
MSSANPTVHLSHVTPLPLSDALASMTRDGDQRSSEQFFLPNEKSRMMNKTFKISVQAKKIVKSKNCT